MNIAEKRNQLRNIVSEKKIYQLRTFCYAIQPVDLADILTGFSSEELLFVFKVLKSEYTAEVFSYLYKDEQEGLLAIFSDKETLQLVENSFTDDIAEFLEDLPANLVKKVLSNANAETREEINLVFNFKNGTAGSLMTTEYIEISGEWSVARALKEVKKYKKDAVTLYTSFVVDDKRNLIGVLKLSDLVFADDDELVSEIVNMTYMSVNVHEDQENVAKIFERYDKTIIPVLNNDAKLVGVITIDDIIDVINEEVSEDIEKMAAVTPLENSYRESSVLTIAKSSIPWLVLLMVLGAFSTIIINNFEDSIASIIIMSTFIPLLLNGAGNAGTQTASLVIRSLTLNEFEKNEYKKIVWKELRISLIVGIIVAAFSFILLQLEFITGFVEMSPVNGVELLKWSSSWWLATIRVTGIFSLTIFISIIIAKVVGAALPLLAKLVKLDPALMANPLITTTIDITALLVYFTLIIILL